MDQLPVFVYGTLRRGQGNHGLVARHLDEVREARLPRHVLFGHGLPYIAACDDPGSVVTGELLVVQPGLYAEALRALDALEGYAPPRRALYVRTRVRTEFRAAPGDTWRECDAWAYLGGESFSLDPRLVIASGDWVAHCRPSRLLRA